MSHLLLASSRTLAGLALATLALVTSVTTAGCGPSAESYCDQICACIGCSDSERSDCVDTFEDAAEAASEDGCDDQFDTLVECTKGELECNDGQIEVDGCDAEAEDLAGCGDGPVILGGDPCQAAIARIEAKAVSCGLEIEQSEPVECTAELQVQAPCLADCFESATCGQIIGEEDAQPYIDCISGCGF